MRVKPSAKAFAALGCPVRRILYERLARTPQTVGELARGVPVSRPAVSQHLRVLRQARLVEVWQGEDGRRVYRLDTEGLKPLTAWCETHTAAAKAQAPGTRRS
jgi:DNA-binding transcriptional ArsR family regulator